MMRRFLRDKKGFVSIYMILWMAVLIPFFLFICIDYTHYISEHVHLKSVTDNASASAVTQINEDLIKYGALEINTEKAKDVAKNIITKSLNLNSDYSPKDSKSLLSATPTIDIQVINTFSEEGIEHSTPAGTVKIHKPSVIVYAEYPVRGLFFGKVANIKKVGVSQVQFLQDSSL